MEPWGTPPYTGSGRYFYRGSWRGKVTGKEENRDGIMGERVAKVTTLCYCWRSGRLAQKNSHCVCWQFIVDLGEAVAVVWWRQKAGWSRLSGQCMREGYGSKSTDNSIAITGNVECCLTWMGVFFFIAGLKLQSTKYSVYPWEKCTYFCNRDDLLLWKGVLFLVIEYILEM